MKLRLALYTGALVLGTSAVASASMADYWTSFTAGVQNTAGSLASDMLPILALLGGLALGERVIRFVLGSARG